MKGIAEPIAVGTVVAGTLDLSAAILSAWILKGQSAGDVLRGIAAGPFGDVMRDGGPLAALAGLIIHYGIMAVIAAVFMIAARARPALVRHPVPIGLAYGALTYIVMYWIVLPARWPAIFPITTPSSVLLSLAFQLFFVGLPIALIAARYQMRGLERDSTAS
ncbi:hypothetical protein [Sphingosinicella humi]|uniref:DUF1440 domain-containing protein n=1 Tax=Allosphingosinicella humi TaxID=2068657 RepID=A0A2U2J1G8_9SPHN|nr:hypothetical protein [Sphingosinicella humi]PWG02166.1 hypothetical protein DF286_04255 [Sphingosinicella humi]